MTSESARNSWEWEQLDQWRWRYERYQREGQGGVQQVVQTRRNHSQEELLPLLKFFLEEELSLQEFNAAFQQRIHLGGSVFGCRGIGGLVLNQLIKHLSQQDHLVELLRAALPVVASTPKATWEARQRMQTLIDWLEACLVSSQVTRSQLQPGRVPFFLSAWWYLQDPENWPLFAGPVRHVLLPEEGDRREEGAPIETYFALRERFLSLSQALGLSAGEVESFCYWYHERQRSGEEEEGLSRLGERSRCEVPAWNPHRGEAETTRTHLHWLLAKLGRKVGCEIWIAPEHRDLVWQQERLGDACIASLPRLGDPRSQQELESMDVLWLHKTELVAAYKLAQTPEEMALSLLHLYDLSLMLPKRDVALCVVASGLNGECVRQELSRPLFQKYGKRRPCGVLARELLFAHEEHILRWASSPTVIEDLTTHLGIGA